MSTCQGGMELAVQLHIWQGQGLRLPSNLGGALQHQTKLVLIEQAGMCPVSQPSKHQVSRARVMANHRYGGVETEGKIGLMFNHVL